MDATNQVSDCQRVEEVFIGVQDRAVDGKFDDGLDAVDRFHDGILLTRVGEGILGVIIAV